MGQTLCIIPLSFAFWLPLMGITAIVYGSSIPVAICFIAAGVLSGFLGLALSNLDDKSSKKGTKTAPTGRR